MVKTERHSYQNQGHGNATKRTVRISTTQTDTHTQRHNTPKPTFSTTANAGNKKHTEEAEAYVHETFFLIDLYWSIIASQYCVSFCCTTK